MRFQRIYHLWIFFSSKQIRALCQFDRNEFLYDRLPLLLADASASFRVRNGRSKLYSNRLRVLQPNRRKKKQINKWSDGWTRAYTKIDGISVFGNRWNWFSHVLAGSNVFVSRQMHSFCKMRTEMSNAKMCPAIHALFKCESILFRLVYIFFSRVFHYLWMTKSCHCKWEQKYIANNNNKK